MDRGQGLAESFLWGAATSAHQVEGNNQHSDWWQWESEGNIAGGIGSGAAADHWNRSGEDLALASGLGMNSYRFSVEWAKLEPEQGRWNEEAFAWYSALLDQCEANGLLPMLTMHHFTLPKWLAKEGGFANERSVKHFERFALELIRRFGPRVPLWCTFNEPMVLLLGSYLGGFMPPALRAPELVSQAALNIYQAHCLAYAALHEKVAHRTGPWRGRPLEVGIAHNMLDFLPDRWWHPLERAFAVAIDGFYNRSWLNAVTGRKLSFGLPGLIPAATKRGELQSCCDFIGVNYYTKAYVRWRPRDASEGSLKDFPIGIAMARRNEVQSDVGWAIHPAGFGKVLRQAASFGRPIYVTENGLADKEDRLRSSYLLAHLREISEALADGIDIRGYFHWSLLDNFEWKEGFGPRFGLFRVNYNDFSREPRPSAQAYKQIIEAHRLAPPNQEILARLSRVLV